MDPSLGSLPTLIVPDDPETGAIERPKTPPPVEVDEARLASTSAAPKAKEPSVKSPREPSAKSPREPSVKSPREPQVKSPRESPIKSPRDPSVKSPRDPSVKSPRAPSHHSAAHQSQAIAVDIASPRAEKQPEDGATATLAVPPPPPSPVQKAPTVSSKDFKTMAKRAAALAKLDRLASGSKSVFDVEMSDIGALGIGMQLYFMLTKYLGVVFLTMGIVSLPVIVVNYYGDGVTSKMVDPLQLAYASLGNQGVSDEIKQDASLCQPDGEIDCTWETVNTPFTSSPVTVSWIITSSDAIYSFVFLLFVVYFRVKARKAIELHQAENLTPAKYSVFVRGLPPDTTKKEILEHFNSRFDPTQEEEYFPLWLNCCWGRRRKVLNSLSRKAVNCNVVSNIEHLTGITGSSPANEADAEMYIGTWIAEVSVAHPTGGLLRTFLSMEALTRNISETEELIAILEREKKEAEEEQVERNAAIAAADVVTAKKLRRQKPKATFKLADEKLLQAARKKLEKLNAQMEKKTSKIKAFKQQQREDRTASLKKPKTPTASEKAPTPVSSATIAPAPSPNDPPLAQGLARQATVKLNVEAVKKAAADTVKAFNLEACECAFVVFNNLESRRRCLRDYRKSTRWLPRKYQPKYLRFRDGKFPLIVVPAPEPSNILWENLEITDRGRLYRRSFTNFVTFLLLLFSCIIISGAQSAQQQFKAKMPPAGLCDYSLPAVYYGSYSFDDQHNAATKNLVWELEWDRNETCSVGSSGETRYHIAYSNGIINALNVSNVPKLSAGESAPVRCVDPCVSDESSTTCSTLPCFDQDLLDAGDECETYMASHSLYCLCTTQLQASINELGIIDGPQALWKDFKPCQGFIKDYLTKNAFIIIASGIVVIVNLLLKSILRAFANFERHSSESAKASAITLKMFMAQFLNTAIIVLVVNAALNLNKVPLVNDLFKGKYHDFQRDWYPTVGMAITMTMLINAFVPHIVLCLQMFIISPIMQCVKRRSIRTQQQMDKLYAGPSFDISVRYPMVLNSVFVTMIFSGGSPVLLFIAALTCGSTFWFDKLSILHMYSVKTAYDEELGETALNLLPWTLVLHLAFSTWMYGNPDLMKSPTLNLGVVFDAVGISMASSSESSETAYDQLLAKASQIDILGQYGFVVKIVRSNVMVMFLFCIITVVGILLSTIWFQVLLPVLRKTVGVVLLACWKRVRVYFRCCCCRRKKRVKPASSDSRSSVNRKSAKVAAGNAAAPVVVVAESPAALSDAIPPPNAPPLDAPDIHAAITADNITNLTESALTSNVNEEKLPENEVKETDQIGDVLVPSADAQMQAGDVQVPPSVDIIEMTVPKSARISTGSPEPISASGTPPILPISVPSMAATTAAVVMSARLSARKKHPVVLPEFTDVFRKSVPRRFKPDTKLGFSIDAESGELVRCWKEETISNGRARAPGERMRTWEALQAPVKTYAIEANAKYRLAFAELVAASRRSRSASTVLSKVDVPAEETDGDHPTKPAAWTDLAAVPPAEHAEPALVGEEPPPITSNEEATNAISSSM